MSSAENTAPAPGAPRAVAFACALALGALAAACHTASLRGPWLLDDLFLIAGNPMIRHPHLWGHLWTTDYWAMLGAPTGLYRPLPMQTFALVWWLGGGAAATLPQHVVNVALHVAVTLLVWRLAPTPARGLPAFAAAAIFATHPVHAEAVANVVGRSELLLALGFLTALAAHRRTAAARTARGGAAWAALTVAGVAAMLFSKETGLLLVGCLLVEDLGTGRLRDTAARRRLLVSYAGIAVVMAVYALLRSQAVTGAMIGPHIEAPRDRLALSATAALQNTRLLLWPAGQRAVWNHPDLTLVPWWTIAVGWALIATGAMVTLLAALRGGPAALAGALLFISSILLLHPVPNTAWVWERGLYVPSIALVWLAAQACARLRAGLPRRVAVGMLLLLALAGIPATRAMDRLYSGELLFWKHQARMNPGDAPTLLSLAQVMRQRGLHADALALGNEALRIAPDRATVVAARAEALLAAGRAGDAADLLTSAATTRLSFHTPAERPRLLRHMEQLARRAGAADTATTLSQRAARGPRPAPPSHPPVE